MRAMLRVKTEQLELRREKIIKEMHSSSVSVSKSQGLAFVLMTFHTAVIKHWERQLKRNIVHLGSQFEESSSWQGRVVGRSG